MAKTAFCVTGLKKWTRGCYGLRYPATVATADAVVYRVLDGEVEILIGVRGKGRWQEELEMICFGGFIDPADASARVAVMRELKEELPHMKFSVEMLPFFITGPLKFSYEWVPEKRKAVNTRTLAQDIPVITLVYLARWWSGAFRPSREVPEAHWQKLSQLLREQKTYAFDHARILEETAKKFKQ